MPTNLITNIRKPAPKWFRILNRIWSPTENTIIVILLALGYSNESLVMLLIKVGSSYGRTLLEAILVESENDTDNETGN